MTSARDLAARLADLLRRERAALAEFLVALADFDRRRLWLELGHASLFSFLHRELGLSKGAAFYRKTAVELLRAHPDIVEPLRDGRLCLSSVVELARVVTPENREQVLPSFFHLSRREAKEVAAALDPVKATPRREVVAALRAPALGAARALGAPAAPCPQLLPAVHPAEQAEGVCPGRPAGQPDEQPLTAPVPTPRPPPSSSEPLSADLARLHLTVSRRFLDKLERSRAALSHSHPGAPAQDILEAGLDLLLERHARRKGLVKRPRREPPPSEPEHVPAHVKRTVWERDAGRCQWPLDAGGVCGSTHQVELDHVVPRGRGGTPAIDNIRLLCRVHNDLAARLAYGGAWMDRFTRGRPASAPGVAACPPP